MPGMSTPQGKKRRADRTFRDEQLDMGFFIALLVAHLPPGKVLLSLDRTNWEHGETPINFLVLGAVVHGFTLPLIWVPLDESGNSHTYARMWLVLKLLRALPAKRWLGLVADREFIGAEWFRFLRRQGIKRAIRIRHSDMLDDMSGKEWFEHVQHGHFHEISEKVFVFGELMRVVATRSPVGDLIIIATDFNARKTWKLYKQRWSIECTFSSFKTRGFDLERTGITEKKPSTTALWSGDAGLDVLFAAGGLARPDPSHSRPETWSQSGQPGASRCSASRGCPALETRTMQGFPGTAHPSFLPARRGWRRSCHLLSCGTTRLVAHLLQTTKAKTPR